jgi:hypothetical protein
VKHQPVDTETLLACLILGLGGLLRTRHLRTKYLQADGIRKMLGVFVLLLGLAATSLIGCGGGGGMGGSAPTAPTTPTGTSIVTITAMAGKDLQTVPLSVTVQ